MRTLTNLLKFRGYHSSTLHRIDGSLCVDMRSDTLTLPTKEMKLTMINASLGDDVYQEDPTVRKFEEKVANITGKDKSLFVPTGTMGNLISVMVHCNTRGSEVLLGDKSHIFLYEQGGIAQLGGIQANTIPTSEKGTFTIGDVESRIRYDDIHCPTTELICIENTHNHCGGKVTPLDWVQEIGNLAKTYSIPLHVDGARLMNASVASGEDVKSILEPCQSASICLSKGLGAPVGSIIVGSEQFIERCRRLRKVLGGGMRQSGVLAAAGLYALDHMVQRLQDDHQNAQKIAQTINSMESLNVYIDPSDVQTNIGMIKVKPSVITPEQFSERLMQIAPDEISTIGESVVIKTLPWSHDCVRYVTHCNIDDGMIEAACIKLKYVINEINDK